MDDDVRPSDHLVQVITRDVCRAPLDRRAGPLPFDSGESPGHCHHIGDHRLVVQSFEQRRPDIAAGTDDDDSHGGAVPVLFQHKRRGSSGWFAANQQGYEPDLSQPEESR